MLDQGTRAAILKLRQQGHSIREIARLMKLSRGAVRAVLRTGSEEPPPLERSEKARPYRDQILDLYRRCRGNLVRVHEELAAGGIQLSYSALTAFCRREGIGSKPRKPAGEYTFAPGQEMQHDTSPQQAVFRGLSRLVQTASLVLCYCRLIFFQLFPCFTRFECKLFLSEAFEYMEGICETCMIDNTHVVVLKGTGRDMVPTAEMAAFAERYGFKFRAHEKGDANRSGRVERPFDYIQNNFLAGRDFQDWEEANRQARQWCDRVNAAFRRHLRASPRDLYAVEHPRLKPLPSWAPPVYRLHHRVVDTEGYVAVHSNRYSVPDEFLTLAVEVRETRDSIEIYRGPRLVARHARVIEATYRKYRLPEHRHPRGQGPKRPETAPQEPLLLAQAPELAFYIEALKKHAGGRATVPLRRLLRLVKDYPREVLLEAVQEAARYGLYDVQRLETMILRRLAGDYFLIPPWEDDDNE